ANNQWNSYLKQLEKNHPKYYKLRFASIAKSLKNIEQHIPNNTTVIRYIYTPKDLSAIVISKNGTKLIRINQTGVKEHILALIDEKNFFENNFSILHNLYLKLWKPLENDIKTDHVIIIPDRDLFNLNFEMLTKKVAKSNQDLATNSLLAKHIISYNYS